MIRPIFKDELLVVGSVIGGLGWFGGVDSAVGIFRYEIKGSFPIRISLTTRGPKPNTLPSRERFSISQRHGSSENHRDPSGPLKGICDRSLEGGHY